MATGSSAGFQRGLRGETTRSPKPAPRRLGVVDILDGERLPRSPSEDPLRSSDRLLASVLALAAQARAWSSRSQCHHYLGIQTGSRFALMSIDEHPGDVREGRETDFVRRHERDVMNFYIATSRDGDSWDLRWNHAGQPIVPRGEGAAGERHSDGRRMARTGVRAGGTTLTFA